MFVILTLAWCLGVLVWGDSRVDFKILDTYFQLSGSRLTYVLIGTYIFNEIIQARLHQLDLAPDWAPLLRTSCLFLLLMIIVLCFVGRDADPASLQYSRFSRRTAPHNMVLGLLFIYGISLIVMLLVRKRSHA